MPPSGGIPGGPGGAQKWVYFGGPGGVKNTPFLGPPGPPPRGASRGGPGGAPGGRFWAPGRPGGDFWPPENHPFLFLMPTSVPTGRVIKYPRKCTPPGPRAPGRPPGGTPAQGGPGTPSRGVSQGGPGTPKIPPPRTPQMGGPGGPVYPLPGPPNWGSRGDLYTRPDWRGTWRSRCRPLSRI